MRCAGTVAPRRRRAAPQSAIQPQGAAPGVLGAPRGRRLARPGHVACAPAFTASSGGGAALPGMALRGWCAVGQALEGGLASASGCPPCCRACCTASNHRCRRPKRSSLLRRPPVCLGRVAHCCHLPADANSTPTRRPTRVPGSRQPRLVCSPPRQTVPPFPARSLPLPLFRPPAQWAPEVRVAPSLRRPPVGSPIPPTCAGGTCPALATLMQPNLLVCARAPRLTRRAPDPCNMTPQQRPRPHTLQVRWRPPAPSSTAPST